MADVLVAEGDKLVRSALSRSGRVALGAVVGAATAALFYEGVSAEPFHDLPASRPAAEAVPEPIPASPEEGPTVRVVTSVSVVVSSGAPVPTTTTATTTSEAPSSAEAAPPPAEETTTTTTRVVTTTPPPPPPTTTTRPPAPPTTTTTTKKPCGLLWC